MTSQDDKWKTEFDSERRSGRYDADIDLYALRREERVKVLHTLLPDVQQEALPILELGSGTGLITEQLAHRYPRARIVAVDGARNMIEAARAKRFFRENADRIQWILADYSTPAWMNEIKSPARLVVSVDALHHLNHDRKQELYREILEMTLPGGLLILSDHMTSREPFYDDPQFSLWIDEIQRKLKSSRERDPTLSLRKRIASWIPEEVKDLFAPNLRDSFVEHLLQEGEDPMPVMGHVDSLREAGFLDVTVEYRFSNFGILSARKRCQ